MNYRLSTISQRFIHNISNALPNNRSIIFTGNQTHEKNEIILKLASTHLHQTQRNQTLNINQIFHAMEKNEYIDFYYFKNDRIKIGNTKEADPYTIRHLLNHFIPYRAKSSAVKIVYIENGAMLQNEAETALLKTLEEPPIDTCFFISIDDISSLKETIISRSMVIPITFTIDPQQVPDKNWDKFWYLSHTWGTEEYKLMEELNWFEVIESLYDALRFDYSDYSIFEDLGWNLVRKKNHSITYENHSKIIQLSFLPLFFSIRDKLIAGQLPSIGPSQIKISDEQNLVTLSKIIMQLFQRLNTRYFGVRPPSLNILFFAFLDKFMKEWHY